MERGRRHRCREYKTAKRVIRRQASRHLQRTIGWSVGEMDFLLCSFQSSLYLCLYLSPCLCLSLSPVLSSVPHRLAPFLRCPFSFQTFTPFSSICAIKSGKCLAGRNKIVAQDSIIYTHACPLCQIYICIIYIIYTVLGWGRVARCSIAMRSAS